MLHLTNKQKHFGKPACILEKSQIKNDQLFYFLTALIIIYFFIFKQVQKKVSRIPKVLNSIDFILQQCLSFGKKLDATERDHECYEFLLISKENDKKYIYL